MRLNTLFVAALLGLVCPAGATAGQASSATAVVRSLKGRIYPAARGRKALAAHEAIGRLTAGQPIYVGLDTGKYRRGKLPEGFDNVFGLGSGSVPSTHAREVDSSFRMRQRVRVSSVKELIKLDATDRLTYYANDASLSDNERKVSRVLRPLAGGVHGSARIAYTETANCAPAYVVKVRGPKPLSRNPGLYAPDEKVGGFLGLGKRPRRLSVLEATNRIIGGKTVLVRDGAGAPYVLSPRQILGQQR